MNSPMHKLLEALRAADQAVEETVLRAGSFLVWGIRARTWHPRFAAAFPAGFLLVNSCTCPQEDARGLEEEIDACSTPLPKATGPCDEPRGPELCAAPLNVPGAAALLGPSVEFERAILERRLAHVDLSIGRRILSELSRERLRLSLPVLVAVKGRPGEQNQFTVYLGVQTQGSQNDENMPPGSAGTHIMETIQVLKPMLPAAVTIGDILQHCRGAQYCTEVQMRVRYDLTVTTEESSELAEQLPADLLPGSFISLIVSWPLSFQKAASLHLLQPPSTLSCNSVLYMRGSHSPDKALLGRHLMDLELLDHLAHPDACSSALQARARPGVLHDSGAVLEAVVQFLEQERRLATCSGAVDGGADAGAPPAPLPPRLPPLAEEADDEERPGRDFVDRLWLKVLARCETTPCLVCAIEAVLRELGHHDGIVPSVRRDNNTQMAELVRTAQKMSTLRKYAALSEARKLREMNLSWEESCRRFQQAESVVPLVFSMGMECLRRDFVHLIMRRSYITAQDLSQYTSESEPMELQLSQLRCLRQIAELALMSTRHRLGMDTMRRLILKAAEYYRGPSKTEGTSVPILAVPLSSASLSRLLSTLPSLDPSSFAIECGGALIEAKRFVAGGVWTDNEQHAPEIGIWNPPHAGSPFEYHVAVIDRFRYTK